MWVPLPALLCEFTGFYELYAYHSGRAGLIHHLGSRGWRKLGGCPPHSSPHSPQSGGTGWRVGLDLLGKGKKGLLGRVERAKGCPLLSNILEVDLLSPRGFSSRQNDPPKVQCEGGVLGCSRKQHQCQWTVRNLPGSSQALGNCQGPYSNSGEFLPF